MASGKRMPQPHIATGGVTTPTGWPSGIAYLRSPIYSKKLPKASLEAVFPVSTASCFQTFKNSIGPSSNVKITKIPDSGHPAYGQYGLFASHHLLPDSLILPYLGYVHDKADTDEASDYDLSIDRELGIGVDASKMGNEARFINDYRGVSSGPNAEFREAWFDLGNNKVEKRMAVFVLTAGKSGKRAKGIRKGEEILVSYGKGFWTERQQAQNTDPSD